MAASALARTHASDLVISVELWFATDLREILNRYVLLTSSLTTENQILSAELTSGERQRKSMFPSLNEYSSLFGLNAARLARTKPDALIMHPGPINRGVEIDSDIADCERSLILEQVTNGLAVRMAVLFLVNGGKGPQEVAAG